MHVGNLLLGTIHIIYILQIRIFEGWNRGCPITTIAHNQQRFRGKESHQLGITRTMPRQLDRFATLARTTAIKMRGEIHCWGCCRDSVVEYRQQDCMRTATTATIRSDARLIHILAMVPHIIEQYLGIQSLNHMGTVGLMRILAIFSLTLSPAIQVEIYTDSTHSCQGSEALLLIGTISAATEMTVGTDNQRMLALLGGRIDGTEDMLARQGLDADILNRITIIPAYLSQNRFLMNQRIHITVDTQDAAHLLAYRILACFKLFPVQVECLEISKHLLTLFGMATGIFIRLDLIYITILLPPIEVEILADIRQGFLQRIGFDAEVGIRQLPTNGIHIIFKADTPALRYVLHHIVKTTGEMPLITVLSNSLWLVSVILRTCRQRHACRDKCHHYVLFHHNLS